MAKSENQKLKLLYLAKIFKEKTDENHGLTITEIINALAREDIPVERKTLYQDFEELRHFGMDILAEKEGRKVLYRLVSRDFELPELKLLVDSVQASKFITEQKSRELIKKLEALVSTHDAKQLHRQVVLSGRVKTMNESIYYTVDRIHEAINKNRQIRFRYFQWNEDKKQALRHDGAEYCISPWVLVWDNENYYLIGYDSETEIIKHYRVDKMLRISVAEEMREGREIFEKMDLLKYSKGLFGMFGGDPVTVTLLCENHLAGPVIDRFGTDIPLMKVDARHFQTYFSVSVSDQFLGWVIALGKGVKIVSPESAVEAMKKTARRLAEQYL